MVRRTVIIVLILFLSAQAGWAVDYVLITLLHTNDMHGRIMGVNEPGLAKVATLVRQIRNDMPNVLLLDAGDIIHDTYENYTSHGLSSITAMNAVPYDAAVIGNHELDFGLSAASAAIDAAEFPFIAANVKNAVTGEQWKGTVPYIIINIRGVKLGIIGLTTHEAASLQWPGSVATIRIDDPTATAKAIIPELKQQADVIILLSHLGYDNDRKLASEMPGSIDFIIGGHSHTVLDKWEWVGNTLITQAGAFAKYLGRIDFIVHVGDSGARIISVNGQNGRLWNELPDTPLGKSYPTAPLIAISPSTPDDQAVVSAYMPYRERVNAMLDRKIGEALDAVRVIPVVSGETPAGDFIADAVRAYANSDIAVIDSHSVAAGLERGRIRTLDAYNMIGGFTRQQIVTVRMTGNDLLAGFKARLVRDKKIRLQVSGVDISFSLDASGGTSINSLTISGEPVDPNKEYIISGQAYIIQEFIAQSPGAIVVSEGSDTTREAVVQYIEHLNKVQPPETNRITREDIAKPRSVKTKG